MTVIMIKINAALITIRDFFQILMYEHYGREIWTTKHLASKTFYKIIFVGFKILEQWMYC